MESKDQIYKELVREAKSANAKLQRLRGNFGEQYGWAGKRLIDKLSIDAVNTVSDKGYIRFNKNLSTVQMKATLKAIKEFKSSKTSTVKGVKENIENVKSGIGSSLDVDNKTAQAIYDFFATDKYKLNDEVKYEALRIALEVDNKNGNVEDYIDIVENYIDFGNDDDLREELISVYDIIKTGKFDINKIKSIDSVRY